MIAQRNKDSKTIQKEFTHRPAPIAYAEIRRFLKKMISSIDRALAQFIVIISFLYINQNKIVICRGGKKMKNEQRQK